MNFCLKEKIKDLEKPVVKNKLSWNMGVYKDETHPTPEISLNVNSNTDVKLITVVAVAAAILLTACICHKISKLFER